MDPISAGLSVIGFGMSIFGNNNAAADAARAADLSKQKVRVEQQNENARHEAMLLANRRTQLEIIRNNQRARAMAITTATSQGASTGSGLQGGLGQISGVTSSNLLNNSQAFEFGNRLYENNKITSELNMQLADVQSSQSRNQGMASLGGSLMSAAPGIGRMSQGFSLGGLTDMFSMPGPGSLSGGFGR